MNRKPKQHLSGLQALKTTKARYGKVLGKCPFCLVDLLEIIKAGQCIGTQCDCGRYYDEPTRRKDFK